MDGNGIDYNKVLADLRARREKLNSAIAGIEEMLGIDPGDPGAGSESELGPNEAQSPDTPQRPNRQHQGQLTSDAFFQMSAADAAKKYLTLVKRPASNKEIADALMRGGYLTNAKNFYANLYTTLLRTTDFVKVKKEWGLADWYPGRRIERSSEAKGES